MRNRFEVTVMKLRSLSGLLIIMAVTAGCALSPQVVDIRPEVTTAPAEDRKAEAALGLEVADIRESPILGKRDGVYKETATISTEGDITRPIRESLSGALENMGYRLVEDGSAQPLKVEIVALEYGVDKEKVTRSIKTYAAINAAYRKGDRTYHNTYKVTRTKKMLTAPGMEENQTLINETLAAALQQMLRDGELFGLIGE
ncbi:MAG: YajG family lipoprotein [Gammaproteobacteria bacterium]